MFCKGPALRVWVCNTQGLATFVSVADEDVTLKVDSVGVGEPEHRIQF